MNYIDFDQLALSFLVLLALIPLCPETEWIPFYSLYLTVKDTSYSP